MSSSSLDSPDQNLGHVLAIYKQETIDIYISFLVFLPPAIAHHQPDLPHPKYIPYKATKIWLNLSKWEHGVVKS